MCRCGQPLPPLWQDASLSSRLSAQRHHRSAFPQIWSIVAKGVALMTPETHKTKVNSICEGNANAGKSGRCRIRCPAAGAAVRAARRCPPGRGQGHGRSCLGGFCAPCPAGGLGGGQGGRGCASGRGGGALQDKDAVNLICN